MSERDQAGGLPAPDPIPLETFGPLLEKEIERSRRYYRGFGLVRVHPSGAGEAREWLRVIPRILRRADLVARAPEDGLYILLPETPASGIPAIRRRLAEALAVFHSADKGLAVPRIGEAAYPRDGETSDELLHALSEESV